MRRVLFCTFVLSGLLLLPFFSICQNLPVVSPEKVGFSSQRLSRVDSVLQDHVKSGQITGAVALIARHGKIVYQKAFGSVDGDQSRPMNTANIFRIASMTKPITGVAAMMLYEEGKFLLTDSVSKYLPEFRNIQVLVPDSTQPDGYRTEAPRSPLQIRHLLNHTSGFTYRVFAHPKLSSAYEKAVIREGTQILDGTIGDAVKRLSEIPLLFHPGQQWNYGFSIDVLGRLVEVVSGMTLNEFFEQRIFRPLRMTDSHFYPPMSKSGRIVDYFPPPGEYKGSEAVVDGTNYTPIDNFMKGPHTYYSGGAGLMSTGTDYWRFAQMLLNGGEMSGVRLLSPRTIDLMTTNSIGDKYINLSRNIFGDKMGLTFGIRTERGQFGELESNGSFMWAGAGHHTFWVDPKEDLIGIIMIQKAAGQFQNLRRIFKTLSYQALVK